MTLRLNWFSQYCEHSISLGDIPSSHQNVSFIDPPQHDSFLFANSLSFFFFGAFLYVTVFRLRSIWSGFDGNSCPRKPLFWNLSTLDFIFCWKNYEYHFFCQIRWIVCFVNIYLLNGLCAASFGSECSLYLSSTSSHCLKQAFLWSSSYTCSWCNYTCYWDLFIMEGLEPWMSSPQPCLACQFPVQSVSFQKQMFAFILNNCVLFLIWCSLDCICTWDFCRWWKPVHSQPGYKTYVSRHLCNFSKNAACLELCSNALSNSSVSLPIDI